MQILSHFCVFVPASHRCDENHKRRRKRYCCIAQYAFMLIVLCGSFSVAAQQKDSTNMVDDARIRDSLAHAKDSAGAVFFESLKKTGAEEAKKSILKFETDRVTAKQELLINEIEKTSRVARDYLKKGIDTVSLNEELTNIDRWFEIAGDGVFTNKGSKQTHRNLVTTSKILEELLNRVRVRKSETDIFENDLVGFRYRIDSLSADSTLYNFPSDTAALTRYLEKLVVVSYTTGPADSALAKVIQIAHTLQGKVGLLDYKLSSSLESIEVYQRELYERTWNREFANLLGPVAFTRPFKEILLFSGAKTTLSLLFYSHNHSGKILLVMALILIATLFLRALKRILRQKQLLQKDFAGQLVLRYPFLSATVIVLNLFQFIFPDPPFIFNAIFWVLSAIFLTIIFYSFISKYWLSVWLGMLACFFLVCADNLILQASRIERWGMFFLAITGVFWGSYILFKENRKELREKLVLYFIALVVLLEVASVIANIYGRYNLSKTLLVSGYFNVVIGILFLWTVRLINEGLALSSKVYSGQDRKLFYINFERVGDRTPTLFYILLMIGWATLFGRNFYVFRWITEPLSNFLFSDRTIGKYTFTVSNLLVFFLIMALTVITSKIVSFFASDKESVDAAGLQQRKAGAGSWVLLLRVSIVCVGLFLAFAAAGIPMDRITLILGALGVGIGLGLQTVVNNLVSGLIIAFEKPVNVGDVVEINGQGGTMKSIGFRSSIISSWAGADLVIPNGDILNAHLINWTMGGGKKRIEIIIGVAYGTDLPKTKQLLLDLLGENDRILKYPGPSVFFQEFNSSAINIQVFFWVRYLSEAFLVKSDVIAAIDQAFKQSDITIPFPQQDVHLHSFADQLKDDLNDTENAANNITKQGKVDESGPNSGTGSAKK